MQLTAPMRVAGGTRRRVAPFTEAEEAESFAAFAQFAASQ
jgi:hypothetical protein